MSSQTLVSIHINGQMYEVTEATSVAAALINANLPHTRTSVSGEHRFALCGMGVCQECRVQVNGSQHVLACQTFCESGMEIQTESMSI